MSKEIPTAKESYYHGSPEEGIEELELRPSRVLNNEKAVFGTPDRDVALSFGRRWRDEDLEHGSVNGQRFMREMYPGAYEKIYDGPGHIYELEDSGFGSDPRLSRSERISRSPTKVRQAEKIDNVLEALRQSSYLMLHHGEEAPWEKEEREEVEKTAALAEQAEGRVMWHVAPRQALDSIRAKGLLSSHELAKDRDALSLAKGEHEIPDWQAHLEKQKDWDHRQGPNAMFSKIPDSVVLPDNHPTKTEDTVLIKVLLDKLLKAHPDTRVHGLELAPFDEVFKDIPDEMYKAMPREEQDKLIDKRKRQLTPEELKNLIDTSPEDLWKHYRDPGKPMYAPDVPHAALITPSGRVDPEFLDFSEVQEKAGSVSPLPLLHKAKAFSDEGQYREKAKIIHAMMAGNPQDWTIDQDEAGSHVYGVTHMPTGFRFHLPKAQVTPGVQRGVPEPVADTYAKWLGTVPDSPLKGRLQLASGYPEDVNKISDVDVLLALQEGEDPAALAEQLKLDPASGKGGHYSLPEFGNRPINLFMGAGDRATRSVKHRNNQLELAKHRPDALAIVQALKAQGAKTEPAWAEALGIQGDPYEALAGDVSPYFKAAAFTLDRKTLPFRQAAEAILLDGDNLVAQMKTNPNTGAKYIKFPGGGIDDGEDPITAVTREMLEEAGVSPAGDLHHHGAQDYVWGPDFVHDDKTRDRYENYQGSQRHLYSGLLGKAGKPTAVNDDAWVGENRIPVSEALTLLEEQAKTDPNKGMHLAAIQHLLGQKSAAISSENEVDSGSPTTNPTEIGSKLVVGPQLTGPGAIAHALGRIDTQALEDEHREIIRSKRVTKRPRAVAILNTLEGLRRNNLKPSDLMIKAVPVIPPIFRPFRVMGSTFVPGDANELYQDTMRYRDSFKETRNALGDLGAADARLSLYDSVKALYGHGDSPNPKLQKRGVAGFLQTLTGTSPKFSWVNSKMVAKPVDTVSRGTITVNPDLTIDEIGIPEYLAWKMYGPFIQRHMVRNMSISPAQAVKNLKEQNKEALYALERVMDSRTQHGRPVIYSRAPSWHKFNVLAAHPRLVKGNSIQINPFVTTGMNADFDGDQMNVHVPVGADAVDEAHKVLMPSKMVWSPRKFDTVVPQMKHEMVLGLSNAMARPAKNKHVFKSEAEALKAIENREISLSDDIEILPEPKMAA